MAAPSLFLCSQIGVMIAATAAAAVLPPRDGPILIWSAGGEAPGRIAGWALDGDTRLIGTGPAGSLIVWGDGPRLASRALAHGALALRAPRALCGGRA
jgi:hypothetical protein